MAKPLRPELKTTDLGLKKAFIKHKKNLELKYITTKYFVKFRLDVFVGFVWTKKHLEKTGKNYLAQCIKD
jgi:hypothetical protein